MTKDHFPYSRACPGISELQPYQPGKPIEELERELGISRAVKLASNENSWGCSPLVSEAIRQCTEVSPYPDANGYLLKAAIACHLNISASQLTLGNGSNDVLDLVVRTFVEPGDEIIFSEYAFLLYPLLTQVVGGTAVVTSAVNWGHDLQAMIKMITDKTKVIFVANPNNPTGTYVAMRHLRQFLDDVPEDVVVVVDEAYYEYVLEDDYPDCVAWLGQYPNLIVTRTFSKIYGLAALRIGFGVASAEITDLLNRVRQPFNVNTLAQTAGIAALEDRDHVDLCRGQNQAQLKRMTDFCKRYRLTYIPSVANFLTVEFGSSTQRIYTSLLRKGIIVRPIDNYKMPNHLRITIGREEEMDGLFDALQSIL